jgi:translocation and assembly module TamB
VSDEVMESVRRRRWPRRLGIAFLVLLALIGIAFAIIWPMRIELAKNYIDGELARRGVAARYQVTRIGFGTQIFENLEIGDPRRPDLTARRVEVQVLIGLFGPRIGLITAHGVRMRGRIENGTLTLGELDKLLGEPSPEGPREPFRLPDQRVEISDTALTLATPAGEVALGVAGRGNLSDGFRGGLAFASNELRFGACVATRAVARMTVRIEAGAPHLRGPAALGRRPCGDQGAERALFALRAVLPPGLDHMRGTAATRVARLGSGADGLALIEGRLGFEGDMARTAGDLNVQSGAAGIGETRAAAARFAGRFAVSPRAGDFTLEGRAGVSRLVSGDVDALAESLRGAQGSPLGPIADALAAALRAAGHEGAEATADVDIRHAEGAGLARVRQFALLTASGARLVNTSGAGLAWHWPSGRLGLDGDFLLTGGGFPATNLHLAQSAPGGPIEGIARIAPMAAGGARLALGEIAFTAAPDGRTSFRTTALLDGPLAGGRVSGLAVPIAGRFGQGGFALGEACVTAGFRALQVQNLRIGPARLPLCPIGRAMVASGPRGLVIGAELREPRLAGHLGGAPVSVSASRLRITSDGFAATRPAAGIGYLFRITRFEAASLTGRFAAGGMAGRFEGLEGGLSGVPLQLSEARGNWRLRGTALALDGRLAVADAQDPARFNPLASEDVHLTLANNRIHATGTLTHPASGTSVALATIDHNLTNGVGSAVLDVPRLAFTPAFQPEALTPLTVGVVALVDGSLSGQGRIDWDARETRSSGGFSTENLNLAAPFGPVEGLSTRIEFTDLLGLVSAPGQSARVRLVRTGIDVYDGEIAYQLQPDYRVAVESARWPLAGGTLTLAPTMLDFSQESTKYLTFHVEALDAARFISQLEFSNIAATGTFDGVVPMQFTQAGGRIVGGRLVARAPGGTLSYVGELSDENLGAYGVLAFDALKSLRYSRFELNMDGALDGEFLTRINLDGIARDTAYTRDPAGGLRAMLVGRVLGQLARIPFHFNIRIQGPFRALVATGRSFQDPGDLIRASLPGLLDAETQAEPRVQAQDSGDVR